jgi:trk system potassium uptake protein TrkA
MSGAGEFAVIGLGRFGRSLVAALRSEAQAVLAIDIDRDRVEQVADLVDGAVVCDTTDEEALAGLDLGRMTCVTVAIGERATEASILTTALLRQIGIPRIVARSFNDLHARVLRAVGAHEVVNPESEMGTRLASQLANPNIVDRLSLGNAEIAEVTAAESYVGKSLKELDLRNRLGVSVLALRRGAEVLANPSADDEVASGDILVMLGRPEAIRKLAAKI